MRAVLVLPLLGACAFHLPGGNNNPKDGPTDTPVIDMPVIDMPVIDMPVDMPPPIDANLCFGTFSRVCLEAAPTAPLMVTSNINTQTSGLCQQTTTNPDGACVIAGTTVSFSGTIVLAGGRPLIVVASEGAITIDGVLDGASHRTSTSGPGANSADCIAPTAPKNSGGGSGGSFGAAGGNGGSGSGGVGGIAAPAQLATKLRGGCAGTTGGGSQPGVGGDGGGALDFVGASVTVNGILNASGAGGNGGIRTDSGAGGGGSGGLIVFDTGALTVSSTGKVVANGGGGGEGSGDLANGSAGIDPNPSNPGTAAAGGSGGTNGGGNGGAGGASTTQTSAAGANGINGTDGGGAAGGGTGIVHSLDASPTVQGVVSPKIN